MGLAVAIKRKSKKRRTSASGVVSGVLIGLLVIGGLCGIGFVGYLIYEKVVVPALAEQRAEKLRQEFAAEQGQPGVPVGWRLYKLGQLQMIVPDKESAVLSLSRGKGQMELFEASADGIDVYISRQTVEPVQGRGSFYDYFSFSSPAYQVIRERKMDGPPRNQEAYVSVGQQTSYSRVFEESPTSLLIIDIAGDINSVRHQDVVRSISYD